MQHNGSWDDTDTIRIRYDIGSDTTRYGKIGQLVRPHGYDTDKDTIRIRYDHDTVRYDSDNDTTRYDTMAGETIRSDADTVWTRYGCDATRYDIRSATRIRYGYGATRYDALVRDNDAPLPPDRVREPIKLILLGSSDNFNDTSASGRRAPH